MANVIYRGPVKDEPSTINLPVTGALKVGSIVLSVSGALVAAVAADDEKQLLILSNQRYKGQDLATAYVSGDTGVAYIPRPNEIYQCRLAAETFAVGDPLTIGAAGRLEAAATTEVVFAFFAGTAGAKSADDLDDVEIANSFKLT